MEQTNSFQEKEPFIEEVLNGKHDAIMKEVLNQVDDYLNKKHYYDQKDRESVLKLIKDFRGLMFSITSVFAMQLFAESYNIDISNSKDECLMARVNSFFEKLKKVGLEDDYIDLVQWIILRPFSFKRFLKASWDNQPMVFADEKKKRRF